MGGGELHEDAVFGCLPPPSASLVGALCGRTDVLLVRLGSLAVL